MLKAKKTNEKRVDFLLNRDQKKRSRRNENEKIENKKGGKGNKIKLTVSTLKKFSN